MAQLRQPVVSLPIAPLTRQALLVSGITYLSDLAELDAESLAAG
jgi:hypothetical protein